PEDIAGEGHPDRFAGGHVFPEFKEATHDAVTGPEGTVAADGRGVSSSRRQASRTRRWPARTDRQDLPFGTRKARRSHVEEAQAPIERSHGRHHPAPPRGRNAAGDAADPATPTPRVTFSTSLRARAMARARSVS